MQPQQRMARYDVRNDGIGPYAAFYCDSCSREYRSQPDVKGTIGQDIGRAAMGDALRGFGFLGRVAADRMDNQDQRYITALTPGQLQAAWKQVEENFHECSICKQIVCSSCFDVQSGTCNDDSPRKGEIAEASAEQVAGVAMGIANAFGFGQAIQTATESAWTAAAGMARCQKDGTLAKPGTKFCPECGSPMVQPTATLCPKCGNDAKGAKFCPECGTKIEQAAPARTTCAKCGIELKGAKFCPACGTKAV